MSCDDREYCRHDIGRRFSDPTRIHDSEGALMVGGGAAVGQAPTHGDTGRSRTTDIQGLVTGAGSSYYLRSGQPRQQQLLLRGQGRLQGRGVVNRVKLRSSELVMTSTGKGSTSHRAQALRTLTPHSRVMTRSARSGGGTVW